ncbi:hypothetical protein EC988_002301 [Linderina pennispora]|nr:hypothetical protein EC988_002301 [Linderina pennispora]
MANDGLHISELAGGDILERILAIACCSYLAQTVGMDNYMKAVQLAAVCQSWRRSANRLLSRVIIVQNVNAIPKNQRSVLASAAKSRWVSNIGSIVAAGMSDRAKDMRVIGAFDTQGAVLDEVLESLGFSAGQWDNVRSITFVGGIFSVGTASVGEVAHSACAYLGRRLPGLVEVDHTQLAAANSLQGVVSNMLIRHFLPQLHTLHIWYPFPVVGLKCIPQNVTKVRIDASLLANLPKFPQIPAPQLRQMEIFELDGEFRWSMFASDPASSQAIFENLEELKLEYSYGEPESLSVIQDELQMAFPKLRKLVVENVLMFYSDFYTLFHDSPLRSLELREYLDMLHDVDPQVIARVHELHLIICDEDLNLSDMSYQDITKFFMTRSPVQHAELLLGGLPLPIPEGILWSELRQLTIETELIDWTGFARMLSQLPHLWSIEVLRSTMVSPDEGPDVIVEGTDPISTSLQTFAISSYALVLSASDVAWVRLLIERAPVLMKLGLPPSYIERFEAYAEEAGKCIGVFEKQHFGTLYH